MDEVFRDIGKICTFGLGLLFLALSGGCGMWDDILGIWVER